MSLLQVKIVQCLYNVLHVRIVQCPYNKSNSCNVCIMSQLGNVCTASQDRACLYSMLNLCNVCTMNQMM